MLEYQVFMRFFSVFINKINVIKCYTFLLVSQKCCGITSRPILTYTTADLLPPINVDMKSL